MNIKNKKLHREDKGLIVKFIDYVRLTKSKSNDYRLELDVRRIAKHMNILSDTSNARLANKFANLLEKGVIA